LDFLAAAFFFAGAFLAAFFFAGMRYPPFQSADAGVNNFVNKFTTRVTMRHDFFVKLFSRNSKTIFKISRAIFFFDAREIVFESSRA
jgi:hypothetical protein